MTNNHQGESGESFKPTSDFTEMSNVKKVHERVREQTDNQLKKLQKNVALEDQIQAFYEIKKDNEGKEYVNYNTNEIIRYLNEIKDKVKNLRELKKLEDSAAYIMCIQIGLEACGYDVGQIDGVLANKGSIEDSQTENAILQLKRDLFENNSNIRVNNIPDSSIIPFLIHGLELYSLKLSLKSSGLNINNIKAKATNPESSTVEIKASPSIEINPENNAQNDYIPNTENTENIENGKNLKKIANESKFKKVKPNEIGKWINGEFKFNNKRLLPEEIDGKRQIDGKTEAYYVKMSDNLKCEYRTGDGYIDFLYYNGGNNELTNYNGIRYFSNGETYEGIFEKTKEGIDIIKTGFEKGLKTKVEGDNIYIISRHNTEIKSRHNTEIKSQNNPEIKLKIPPKAEISQNDSEKKIEITLQNCIKILRELDTHYPPETNYFKIENEELIRFLVGERHSGFTNEEQTLLKSLINVNDASMVLAWINEGRSIPKNLEQKGENKGQSERQNEGQKGKTKNEEKNEDFKDLREANSDEIAENMPRDKGTWEGNKFVFKNDFDVDSKNYLKLSDKLKCKVIEGDGYIDFLNTNKDNFATGVRYFEGGGLFEGTFYKENTDSSTYDLISSGGKKFYIRNSEGPLLTLQDLQKPPVEIKVPRSILSDFINFLSDTRNNSPLTTTYFYTIDNEIYRSLDRGQVSNFSTETPKGSKDANTQEEYNIEDDNRAKIENKNEIMARTIKEQIENIVNWLNEGHNVPKK